MRDIHCTGADAMQTFFFPDSIFTRKDADHALLKLI